MGGLGSNIIAILPNLCIAAYLVVSHRVYLLLTVLSSVLVLSLLLSQVWDLRGFESQPPVESTIGRSDSALWSVAPLQSTQDGNMCCLGGSDDGTVQLWDLDCS